METSNIGEINYTVFATINVDRPERRNGSFHPVPAGTRQPFNFEGLTYSAAIRIFNAILGGEYDYSSEFVSSVWVRRNNSCRIAARNTVRRTREGDKIVNNTQS